MKITAKVKYALLTGLSLAAVGAGLAGLILVVKNPIPVDESRVIAAVKAGSGYIQSAGNAFAGESLGAPVSASAISPPAGNSSNEFCDVGRTGESGAGQSLDTALAGTVCPSMRFDVSDGVMPGATSQENKNDIADLKEKMMRERFGVVCRRSKWIPTVNGGTDMVYITTGSIPAGRVNENYEIQFQAEGGYPPYQWLVVEGELPRSLSFSADSGLLRGMPDEPVSVKFKLEATDSRDTKDMAEYVLVVQPEQLLEIVTDSLPAAVPGSEYFCQMQASGGIPPYTWNAFGNIAEAGSLILDSITGQLIGMIDAATPEMDIPLVVWLGDAQLQVSRGFVLRVRSGLSILEVPRSAVRISDSFEFVFQAAGGMAPYFWGISGPIPPGLTFSDTGVLAGVPETTGAYDLDVWTQDADGLRDIAQFRLEVLPALEASVSGFQAFLSRNSVGLSWGFPAVAVNPGIRLVRSSAGIPRTPSDGTTVYCGGDTTFLDGDVGQGSYCYAAFLEDSGVIVTSPAPPILSVTLPPEIDPFADGVVSAELLHPNAFRADELPGIVLGPPRGRGLAWGSADVVSLGAAVNDDAGASAPYGGVITLEFKDNCVWDGPGADFTVFENVFYIGDSSGVPNPETRFMEPAVVAVSQDGICWHQFKFDFSPRYHPGTGELNLRHPYCYNSGFAGVNPVMSNGYDPDPTDPAVSGGDSFDIGELGLEWIRFVRIQSTGSGWLVDYDGDYVMHNEGMDAANRNSNKAGFDLDAVTAIWMTKVTAE